MHASGRSRSSNFLHHKPTHFGYVSLHNLSDEVREFSLVLDRTLGLPFAEVTEGRTYVISTPLKEDADALPKTATVGRSCQILLPPRAIRIMEFSARQSQK